MEQIGTVSPAVGAGPVTRGRSTGQALGLGLAGGAAAIYVGLVDPASGGWFPTCPLRSLTGLWCPVCGMTRAVHHLFQGELLTAMRFHLFVAPIVLALAVVWVTQVRRAFGRAGPPSRLSPPWVALSVGLIATFTVLRNLPGLGVLRGLAV